jgi:hypothetical protein
MGRTIGPVVCAINIWAEGRMAAPQVLFFDALVGGFNIPKICR